MADRLSENHAVRVEHRVYGPRAAVDAKGVEIAGTLCVSVIARGSFGRRLPRLPGLPLGRCELAPPGWIDPPLGGAGASRPSLYRSPPRECAARGPAPGM